MSGEEPGHIVQLRETLRRFVATEMPRDAARAWDRDNVFPRAVFGRLAALGVMGLTVPEAHGGSGIDLPACMAVIEELAKRSAAVACPYIMAACYAGMNLVESGSEMQKASLLPRVAAGTLLFAYGLSEPNVGGDLARVETTVRRAGGKLVINGTKRWCTGAHIADYIFCLARSGPADARHRNLTIVLVPPGEPGITISPLGHLGIRGVETADVHFYDVAVPEGHILGGPEMWDQGWRQLASRALEVEKLELSAVALGIAEAALADARAYAEERVQFGKPIGQHQAVRHLLADAATKTLAMRLMLGHATALAQADRPCAVETAMAKLFCCETAAEVALACQRVLGAYGLSDLMDLERYVRDAISLPIVGGSSQMQRNNIANRLRIGD